MTRNNMIFNRDGCVAILYICFTVVFMHFKKIENQIFGLLNSSYT